MTSEVVTSEQRVNIYMELVNGELLHKIMTTCESVCLSVCVCLCVCMCMCVRTVRRAVVLNQSVPGGPQIK